MWDECARRRSAFAASREATHLYSASSAGLEAFGIGIQALARGFCLMGLAVALDW